MASPLAHGQLLQAIGLAQTMVEQADTKAATARGVRNNLIQDALTDNAPYKTLMKLTGLSRQAIINIGNGPRADVEMPGHVE